MLSKKQIKKFQALYKKRLGKEISRGEALEQGIKLVHLMKLIYKPMNKREHKTLQKRRAETNT